MNNEEKILEMLVQINTRLDKLEVTQAQQGEQLNRMEERLEEVDARSRRSAVLLETDVAREIHLVYEGQEMLRQKMEELTPKDRTETLEGDVAVLKDAYKLMRQEINELKKAQ